MMCDDDRAEWLVPLAAIESPVGRTGRFNLYYVHSTHPVPQVESGYSLSDLFRIWEGQVAGFP
jgi:hypothetical protein